MARFVHEVMNRELFAVTPSARTEDVLEAILEYGITAVPVIDDERKPIGVTSLRDLVRTGSPARMSSPPSSVSANATIEDAARSMADRGLHHLVVTDEDGRAIGMLSSLDLLSALIGFPVRHPSTFPHFDAELGVAWTDPLPLDAEHTALAPESGGVLVLSVGAAKRVERDVWAEAVPSLRARLVELLELPQNDAPNLSRLLGDASVRFRCAVITDETLRAAVAKRICTKVSLSFAPESAAVDEERSPTAG